MHGQEIEGPKCLCHVQEQEEPYDAKKKSCQKKKSFALFQQSVTCYLQY